MSTSFDMFGVECSPGWSRLYQPILDACKAAGVTVAQCKEKFGQLRIYTYGTTPEIEAMIDAAEAESAHVCEECGKPGVLDCLNGWWRTECEECKANRVEKRRREDEEYEARRRG